MTQLGIKLRQPGVKGHVEAGAVVTLRLLADSSGKVAETWWTRETSVPIMGEDGQSSTYTIFDLPAGGYYSVDVTRPRGPDVSREYLVQQGATLEETIELDVASHDLLGWQQYAGLLRSDTYGPKTSQALPPRSRTYKFFDLLSRGARKQDKAPPYNPLPKVFTATQPAWNISRANVEREDSHREALNWTPRRDDQFVTWSPPMPTRNERFILLNSLQDLNSMPPWLDNKFPRWLAFKTNEEIALASVPWPWWGSGQRKEEQEKDEGIQFLYDLGRSNSEGTRSSGRLRISVQDHRWFGLLEFLASGRLNRVADDSLEELLRSDDPEQALYDKIYAPHVAVAGGIILVTRAKSTEWQTWDPWLANLSNWFPGIPDGPILLGCRQLQRPREDTDVASAYLNLREGIRRGIPFFSATIRMLAMALAQIGSEIPAADNDQRDIAFVSSRVDSDQPFTVIRL